MTISIEYAKKLREEWIVKVSPLCDHRELRKEKSKTGIDTGDYVCATCGEAKWGNNWNKRTNLDAST